MNELMNELGQKASEAEFLRKSLKDYSDLSIKQNTLISSLRDKQEKVQFLL